MDKLLSRLLSSAKVRVEPDETRRRADRTYKTIFAEEYIGELEDIRLACINQDRRGGTTIRRADKG